MVVDPGCVCFPQPQFPTVVKWRLVRLFFYGLVEDAKVCQIFCTALDV